MKSARPYRITDFVNIDQSCKKIITFSGLCKIFTSIVVFPYKAYCSNQIMIYFQGVSTGKFRYTMLGGGGQIFVLIKFFSGLVTRVIVEIFDRNIAQTSLQTTNSTMQHVFLPCLCQKTWFYWVVEVFGSSGAIFLVPNIHIRQFLEAIAST